MNSILTYEHKRIIAAANTGDEYCQYYLGRMYFHGWGVEQDYKAAMEWFMKAAAQKHITAHYEISEMYENGHGVEKNIDESIRWYDLYESLSDWEIYANSPE